MGIPTHLRYTPSPLGAIPLGSPAPALTTRP